MIIYNVTVKVDIDIHDEWIQWMKQTHIPDVMQTKKFVDYKILRILAEDEREGVSYSIQYRARTMSDYFDYQHEFASVLQKEHTQRFNGKFVAFRTLLKEVS